MPTTSPQIEAQTARIATTEARIKDLEARFVTLVEIETGLEAELADGLAQEAAAVIERDATSGRYLNDKATAATKWKEGNVERTRRRDVAKQNRETAFTELEGERELLGEQKDRLRSFNDYENTVVALTGVIRSVDNLSLVASGLKPCAPADGFMAKLLAKTYGSGDLAETTQGFSAQLTELLVKASKAVGAIGSELYNPRPVVIEEPPTIEETDQIRARMQTATTAAERRDAGDLKLLRASKGSGLMARLTAQQAPQFTNKTHQALADSGLTELVTMLEAQEAAKAKP